jgi:hypothetical protein
MAETAEIFKPRPEEETIESVPGMLCLLSQVVMMYREDLPETVASLAGAIERARALEALWSATKAEWANGQSPEFTAAVQRLKKLEAGTGQSLCTPADQLKVCESVPLTQGCSSCCTRAAEPRA